MINNSIITIAHVQGQLVIATCPVWAQELRRISPPRFLAECRIRQLNQARFVLLYFVLFAFSGLCLVFVVSVLDLSSVTYFPAYTDVTGTV